MARKSKEAQTRLIQKYIDKGKASGKREALKKIISSQTASSEEKTEAMLALQKRPVKESPIHQTSRCPHCGRIQAVYRRFNLCRCCVRKFFVKGYLPGVVKSSW